jgi:NAD(P)H-flavin reductase
VNDIANATIPLPVVAVREVGPRQVLMTLSTVGTSLAETHETAGQYVKLSLDGALPRPVAIASAPKSGERFEFLLKVAPELRANLLAMTTEDRLPCSRAQGKGYPLALAHGKALWLFASGSGVAPLRSVVEHIVRHRHSYQDVTLLYGVRHVEDLAFRDRFGTWAGQNIQVIPVVSKPEPGTWDGRTGWVQQHLPTTFAKPADVVAFVCGRPEMDRDVVAALLQRGVGPEQVHRNW